MKLYRIERQKYITTTLTGAGAAMCSGFRWNSQNTRLVYTSGSRSLAMLEVSVHLDLSEDLPTDRFCIELEIPDRVPIQTVDIRDLPSDWDAKPPGISTQQIGDDFVFERKALVLKVPSCIVPEEYNYLINPDHEDFKLIRLISSRHLLFDQRWKIQK
jgi:RES domain-containing protein